MWLLEPQFLQLQLGEEEGPIPTPMGMIRTGFGVAMERGDGSHSQQARPTHQA